MQDMEIGGIEVDQHGGSASSPTSDEDINMDLRRGPWTVEEDLILTNYIASHGEGRWNSLARCAGLKRTGKSCRLRWLNYLRPDVRRGNITPEEQLLILELHSRWGNRWSKIAQHLPGRTDNEIKNYWRTRVQKHAKQLKCDVNSKQFKDLMRYLWMPRLMERIQAANQSIAGPYPNSVSNLSTDRVADAVSGFGHVNPSPEYSGGPGSSFDSSVQSAGTHISLPLAVATGNSDGGDRMQLGQSAEDSYWMESLLSPVGYPNGLPDMDWFSGADLCENLWSMEDNWLISQQQQQQQL